MERAKPDEVIFNGTRIAAIQGDIVDQQVDAIVNAANNQLRSGSGVDGAIHRAAGWPQLQNACRSIGYCEIGSAVITPGFKLKAKYIIHTVGPTYVNYSWSEAAKKHNKRAAYWLERSYQSCLEVAKENGVRTIAFPAISTGIFEYPIDSATQIAVPTVLQFLRFNRRFRDVRFVVDYDEAYSNYMRVFKQYGLID